MSVKSPSYLTKSHHGVYYFQIRVDKILRIRLGISSKLYRKSLKTKDRKVALRLARRLWVELYADDEDWYHMSKIPKVGTEEYDLWEAKWQDAERVKSKAIRVALKLDEELSKIPKWDFDSRESFIEGLNSDEHAAMQYVSENNIILDQFREKNNQALPKNSSTETDLKSRRLSELLEDYLNDVKSNKSSPRTVLMYRDQITMFIEIVTDLNSSELTYDDVNRYKTALLKIPKNRNKKKQFKNIPLLKLVKMDIAKDDLLSDSSRKTYSTNVKAFLDWAVKRNFIANDVVTALDKVFRKSKSYPYLPFTNEDLKKIFLSAAYLKGTHKSASRYWVPLIALFTGARANEICQLSVSDIKSETIGDLLVNYFDFNDSDYKSLKNESSRRIVPIHPELLKLDFLQFVEAKKRSGSKRIFSELNGKDGKFGHDFSKWFSRYLKSCSVESIQPDRRKVFHSFRHTFSNSLRSVKDQIPIENIEELVGHAHKGTTLKIYARELSLSKKMDTISKLKFDLKLGEIRRWRER